MMVSQKALPQTALKYDAEVRDHGRVEITVPFAPGARVVVFVIVPPQESFDELVAATQSSLAFWENPWDEEWNHA